MSLFRFHVIMFSAVLVTSAAAQDQVFIFGKVTTDDGKVYQGPIRWGKEEVYWTDIFNGSKDWNESLQHLSEEDRESLDDRHMTWYSSNDSFLGFLGGQSWRGESNSNYVHQFACQFGDIKSIRPTGSKSVELEMRNGKKVEVDGEGYNDVGLDIRVIDPELGQIDLYWNKIEKVEFTDTPAKLENKFGEPLYGTVEAFGSKFKGYIQWDHDERLTTDKLDGDSEDGNISIQFGNIRSIERRGGKSLVVLKSGRELLMDGSNDVSSGHRGVIIESKEFPAINVPWDEFDKVIFEDKATAPLVTYADFKDQAEITGKVITTGGDEFSGKIVYDLDESFNYELLQGMEGEFEYTIPFRAIRKITTKGEHRCVVELKSGKQLTLDESQDVADRNHGMLILRSNGQDKKYVLWSRVREISIN